MNNITVSEHAKKRARERVYNGGELFDWQIGEMFLIANCFGLDKNTTKNIRLKQYLSRITKKYNYTSYYKIYGGFVFIFDVAGLVGITMYPVPDYAPYELNYGN